MTKGIRSPNVEKFSAAQPPVSSFGNSFGFGHSSFGFEFSSPEVAADKLGITRPSQNVGFVAFAPTGGRQPSDTRELRFIGWRRIGQLGAVDNEQIKVVVIT